MGTAGVDVPLPMKAVAGSVPTEPGWAFEIKWDGMRIVASVDAGDVRLFSARGAEVTHQFPELGVLGAHLGGHGAVLDGEVVAFDDAGRTDFGRLQPRMHGQRPSRVAQLRRAVPVTYVVFDLLAVDDTPTLDLAYLDRRRLLADLVEPVGPWTVPTHQVGDGPALFEAAGRQGLEGIVAKRVDSTSRPGQRSPTWRKCKVRRVQEAVVGGWTPGQGNRSATMGSLLVGVHDPAASGNPLRFAGGVGTGFTDARLTEIMSLLAPLERATPPFDPPPPRAITRGARWVEPVLVVQVEYAHWTDEGRLRHPSYRGWREDKDPADVVREPDPS